MTKDVETPAKGVDLGADRGEVVEPRAAVEPAQRREQAAVDAVEFDAAGELVLVSDQTTTDAAQLVLDAASARHAAVPARPTAG